MKPSCLPLCSPDEERTCFACCPPIRPAGYEHIQYENSVKRILRENTLAFDKNRREILPITGYSCWALGYLDRSYRSIGCLLHPARNGGRDFRYRVDYGEKCRREMCLPARVFDELRPVNRTFWLQMADGLDAFSYSSQRINPLFRLMGWGAPLLSRIALREQGNRYTWPSFLERYAFFTTDCLPKGTAYLLNRMTERAGLALLKETRFKEAFENFLQSLFHGLAPLPQSSSEDPYTHHLDLDPAFLDLLRVSLSLRRIAVDKALALKEIIDSKAEQFLEKLR